jgi:hypothetical protein
MKLFKYFGAARAIEVLQSSELYLVNAADCNDPFEFTANPDTSNATIDALKQVISREEHFRFWCNEKYPSDDVERWREYYYSHLDDIAAERMTALPRQAQLATNQVMHRAFDKDFVAGCFSTKNDSILMWAHYGEKHTGIVIEFDTEQPPFNELSEWIRPVTYVKTKPLYKHNYADSTEGFGEQFFTIGSTKFEEWIYEGEVRLIMPIHVSIMRDRHFLRISHEAIRSVIFGFLCDGETRSKVEKILSFRYLSHVTLFRAITSTTDYKLDIIPYREGA